MNPNQTAEIISLCTGIGTLDDGIISALGGGQVVAFSEINQDLARWYRGRNPGAIELGDVKSIDWTPWREPGRYVLTAGYPCQPFSVAGRKLGVEDPRHIWPDIARAIREVVPRLVFLENVRGHLRLGFDEVLGSLASSGYNARWGTLRSSDIGAPHKRERLFILAWPADASSQGPEEWQEQSARNELAPA